MSPAIKMPWGFSSSVLADTYGPVYIYMLPFLKPVQVSQYFPEAEAETYTDALRTAVEQLEIHTSLRNILVTHQFWNQRHGSHLQTAFFTQLQNRHGLILRRLDGIL